MTHEKLVYMKNYSTISLFQSVNLNNAKQVMFLTTEIHPLLDNIDLFCIVFFTLELFAHFFTCPRKIKFFTYVLNVLDLYLVVAMWTTFAIETQIEKYLNDSGMINFYTVLKASLVLRLLRFFRLMKEAIQRSENSIHVAQSKHQGTFAIVYHFSSGLGFFRQLCVFC